MIKFCKHFINNLLTLRGKIYYIYMKNCSLLTKSQIFRKFYTNV